MNRGETTYLNRLRAGHIWLADTDKRLGVMEANGGQPEADYDRLRDKFLAALDAWDEMERQLRQLFLYQGCVMGAGLSCPAESPVRCAACGDYRTGAR